MLKNCACEKKLKRAIRPTFCKNFKFLRCGRIIVQLKMENHVWQPIFNQSL